MKSSEIMKWFLFIYGVFGEGEGASCTPLDAVLRSECVKEEMEAVV